MIEKVAIVTGGSRGIGLSIAKKFIDLNFKVIICSRKGSRDLDHLLETSADSISWVEMDLQSQASVKLAAKTILQSHKHIDVLVNCAGIAFGSTFLMTKIEELKSMFDVNYFNTLFFTQLIVKKMIRDKCGSIINISSIAGIVGGKGMLSYGGSKAALIHATRVMASELGAFGIRVNAIAPSIVLTDMGSSNDKKFVAETKSRMALNQDILASDIAEAVAFLSSASKSKGITGQVLRIDNGLI